MPCSKEDGSMEIYLAGGINGNCKTQFTEVAKLAKGEISMDMYLARANGRYWCVDEYIRQDKEARSKNMDLYLAGAGAGATEKGRFITQNSGELLGVSDDIIDLAILESFYYADEYTEAIIPKLKKFLLDSGAFTFFSKGKHIDWDDYLQKYISFINKNKVERFFELDIDVLVGYPKVLEFRKILEAGTGKKCIPVWHKSRGKAEFLKMCDQYDYVAIGGIVSKEITSQEYKYFPWFIKEAHMRGAKIHGLGFTNLEGLKKYKFDSVDSTSWTTGNRFGAIYTFNGKTMEKAKKPEGKRLKDARASAIRNFNEWVKFQKYAERNL